MAGVARGGSVSVAITEVILVRSQPVTTFLPVTVSSVNHHRNRVEVEQLCQCEAVLAVGAPVDGAVAADVDADFVDAMAQSWVGDTGEVVLSLVAFAAKRVVQRIDLSTPRFEAGHRPVAPRVAKAVQLVGEGLVERSFFPRPPVDKALSEAANHCSLSERFGASVPVATDNTAELRPFGCGFEHTLGESVGVDANQRKRIAIGVSGRCESVPNGVELPTATE